eukprot:m.130480 g.130480  ORF g.130480 m.130480 type:complete len:665 (+) comp16435_c0_seq1:34-2028(+)
MPIHSSSNSLLEACAGACVFVDRSASEALRWTGGGCAAIIAAGAEAVFHLETFSEAADGSIVDFERLVFVLGRNVVTEGRQELKKVIAASAANDVLVFCLVSEDAHHAMVPNLTQSAYSNLGMALEEWMTTQRTATREASVGRPWVGAQVRHLSLPAVPLVSTSSATTTSPVLLLLPRSAHFHPRLPLRASDGASSPPYRAQLSATDRTELTRLVSQLAETLCGGGGGANPLTKDSVQLYSCGPAAKLACQQLLPMLPAAPAGGSSSSGSGTTAVLVVDRNMDLVEPALHSDELAARVFGLLNPPAPHSSDRLASMADACAVPSLAPHATLAHPDSAEAQQMLHAILTKPAKEALLDVRRILIETMQHAGCKVEVSAALGKVTAPQLHGYLAHLKELDATKLAQVAPAAEVAAVVAAALNTAASAHWDRMLSIEKVLLLSAEDSREALLGQVVEQLPRPSVPCADPAAAVRDAYALALVAYGLTANANVDKLIEAQLRKATSHLLASLKRSTEKEIDFFVSNIIDRLRAAKETAALLKRASPKAANGAYIGALAQLAAAVADGAEAVPDLELEEAEDKGLLKSGFGMFGSMVGMATKPKLSEARAVVLVVLGAVAPAEIRAVQNAFKKDRLGRHVTVIATRIATPLSTLHAALDGEDAMRSLGL